ncbi:MAG: glycosyltransferase family 9 protein [Gemmatimonadales bacterium]|nr:glycosyltransferase family 9 protein [Gemmatimonadales bacterium]
MPYAPLRNLRILVVRFSSIGDILLITPLLRALRRRYPDCHLTVLTKRTFRPLLSDNPRVDRILELSNGNSLRSLAREIRQTKYTHKLDLHGNLRSRLLRTLAPGDWFGYSKRRIARTALIRLKRDAYPPDTPPTAERFFEAARALDVTPDGAPAEFCLSDEARSHADHWLAMHGLATERPIVAIAPRTAHETKSWPMSHWLTLVQDLAESGVDSVVVGGAEEAAACQIVAEAGGARAISVAGLFGLQRAGAVIARAQALVSGDTGAMHMGTALGTPVVALFGPTVQQFGFFPYNAPGVVLERSLPCRPCSKMGGAHCPLGHHRCMRDIAPGEVRSALDQWL